MVLDIYIQDYGFRSLYPGIDLRNQNPGLEFFKPVSRISVLETCFQD